MRVGFVFGLLLALAQPPLAEALQLTRRGFTSIALTGSLSPRVAHAADGPVQLTDEEMEARVARKMELLRQQSASSSGSVYEANIRSDYNPDAAVALRSRSFVDNAKVALSKQKELKARDKKQKRDDLCEMLGRGC